MGKVTWKEPEESTEEHWTISLGVLRNPLMHGSKLSEKLKQEPASDKEESPPEE